MPLDLDAVLVQFYLQLTMGVAEEFGGGECWQMIKGTKCILYKFRHVQWRGTVVTGTEVPVADGNK